jgi:hypothetical protein
MQIVNRSNNWLYSSSIIITKDLRAVDGNSLFIIFNNEVNG